MITKLAAAFDKAMLKIEGWLTDLVVMLPNFVVAVILLILFFLLSRLIRKGISRILKRVHYETALTRLAVTATHLVIMGLGLFLALNVLHLDKAVSSLLAGVGIFGLALGFAFQEITTSFISGIILAIRKPFAVGTWLQVGDYYGEVLRIDLWTTVLKNVTGQQVSIPNKDVLQSTLVNYSQRVRRIDLEVGISYGEKLPDVEVITKKAIQQMGGIREEREVAFYFTGFGDSSINFVVQYWVSFSEEKDYMKGMSEGIKAIKAAYDKHDIMIPFPIRTLDFGIKGGQPLTDMIGKQ